MSNFSKEEAAQEAMQFFTQHYECAHANFSNQLGNTILQEIAKRSAIKTIIDHCQCEHCIEVAYQVHLINFFKKNGE